MILTPPETLPELTLPELSGIYGRVAVNDLERAIEAQLCERSLAKFLRHAWPVFDPVPYVHGWHLDAICEHLEAVSNGEIRKLLINVPPRSCKTSAVAVAWPTWTWALPPKPDRPLHGPGVRFLCGSYGAKKAQEDGVTARRLISSNWYQQRWGERVRITEDRDNQERYDTLDGGSRINTGIPESLGKGGMIRILDDPHKTDEVESDLVRDAVLRAYDEIWTTRSNDPAVGAEVIIMQRLAQNDLSGHVLERDGWVHLNLPAEYESKRHCHTVIGFEDPRGCDTYRPDRKRLPEIERVEREGLPLWPERMSLSWLVEHAAKIGPYAYSGQYQQAPIPRGGGIIQREWWQLWKAEQMPGFGTVVVSLDAAYTERQQNDYSAVTVWGAFADADGRPKLMLRYAWRARYPLHKLVEELGATCVKHHADYLLIEGKGPGHSVAQEVQRLYGTRAWQTRLVDPKGQDKVARLQSVQHLFAGSVIFAPETDWAEMVIAEVEQFPRAKYDDLTDSVSQAIRWMRDVGVSVTRSEHDDQKAREGMYRKPSKPLYDV